MADATVVLDIDADLKAAFADAAKAADCTTSELLLDFMRHYVEQQNKPKPYDAWLLSKVEAGRDAVRTGRTTSSEEVESYFAARRTASRRKIATSGL